MEQQLREAAARDLFTERVNDLGAAAIAEPSSLDEIVAGFGLSVATVDGVTEAAGTGPFNYAHVREAAFAPDVLDQGFNSGAVEFGDSRALVMRVVERNEARLQDLADVAETVTATLTQQQAATNAYQSFSTALEQAKAGESTAKIAAGAGLSWVVKAKQRRGEVDLPPAIARAAFTLPVPAEGGKSVGEATLASGANVVVTVTQVEDGDVSRLSDTEVQGIKRYLENRAARLDFASIYQSLEDQADITRPQLN